MNFLLLRAKQIWTWLLLVTEGFSVALWKPATWLLFFFGLWIFDPFQEWGDWLSYGLSAAFFGGLVYFLFQARIKMPSWYSVNRRLERDSGVKHHPLEHDTPSSPSDHGILWDRNRAYLQHRLRAMKWARPRKLLAAHDPYAVRMLGLLFLLCGILTTGSLSLSRIHDGLFPFAPSWHGVTRPPNLTLWITPPEYTGAKQIILHHAGDRLAIPAFSSIKANIRGGIGVPALNITSEEKEPITQEWAFERIDNKQYSSEFSLPENLSGENILSVRQSVFTKLSQDFLIIEDHAPEIFAQESATILPDSSLRFALAVRDDYGTESLSIYMQLDPALNTAPLGEAFSEKRIVISAPGDSLNIHPVYDLTHHNWAGLPVSFSFEIRDSHGQVAFLGPIYQRLPERVFQHPIAKQLIAYRKQLIWSPYANHGTMAQELDLLLTRPDLFQGDLIVALVLRAASSRLYYTHEHDQAEMLKTAEAVIKLLWDTALRIEDGNLSLAARDLKNARQDLQDALQNPDTSNAQKTQLMEALKQAMAAYFKELQKEMQKRMANNENMIMQTPLLSPESMANILSSQSLSDFLEKMEAQIMNGEVGSAQDMLSQLEKLMQMMNPNAMQEMPQDMQMMQQGIGALQKLIDAQQDLLDQTTQQDATIQRNVEKALRELYKRPDQRTLFPPIDTQAKKTEQESLRHRLGELMHEMAEMLENVPKPMEDSEGEMQGSAENLAKNMPGGSMPHQQRAIDYLKEAQDTLSEQLSQRMQQMVRFSIGSSGAPGGYDPLGRPYDPESRDDAGAQDSDVQIPDEMSRRRVQEIQKMLRDRSGEYERPEAERAYYRRLLKTF